MNQAPCGRAGRTGWPARMAPDEARGARFSF